MKRLHIVGGLMVATAAIALVGAACSGGNDATPTATKVAATATMPPATATTVAKTTTSATAAATRPPATATTVAKTTTSATAAATSDGAGDSVKGQAVFNSMACNACHSTGTNTLIGPGLGGIATRAATRKAGMTAQAYLEESELTPDAFIVSGFNRGIMPKLWTSKKDAGFSDIIAYLLTLK
ncbi:MAG: c-type cytochrome [Dehalococcoidia bacterium]|nr:c-type cytochrome [Dehalococcoidia bacterium]